MIIARGTDGKNFIVISAQSYIYYYNWEVNTVKPQLVGKEMIGTGDKSEYCLSMHAANTAYDDSIYILI